MPGAGTTLPSNRTSGTTRAGTSVVPCSRNHASQQFHHEPHEAPADPQAWRAQAAPVQGSWWTCWEAWLRKPESGIDLAFVQGELLREDVTAAAKYWQDLASAVVEMNTELLVHASKLVDTEDLMAATSARFLHS